MQVNLPPLLITMGDAAGIGPEIIAKSFRDSPLDMAGCVVVGDVATMRRASQLTAAPVALPVVLLSSLLDAPALPPRCIGVLQKCELLAHVVRGLQADLIHAQGAVQVLRHGRSCRHRRASR